MAQNCKCPACNPINQPNFEYVAPRKLTLKERIHKQRMENFDASDRAFEYVQANQGRYAEHRASILAEREMAKTGYLDSFNDVRDSVSGVVDDVIGAAKQIGNDLIASQRAMLAEHLVDKGVVQVSDTATGSILSPDEVAKRYGETETFEISDLEKGGASAIKSIPAYGSVLLVAEAIGSKGKSIVKDPASLIAPFKGRAGKQKKLRSLVDEPKLGTSDRGWIQQEINAIDKGKRKSIRNPPGKDLAHERGREAAKGYGYQHSNLQDRKLHRLQHKYDNFGRKNKERPID